MSVASDRPTRPAVFDVEEYAKDSDARVAAAEPYSADEAEDDDPLDTSEVRISARPALGEFLDNEAWAQEVTGKLVVTAGPAIIRHLPLDHRAGYLLSLMDGTLDLDTLIEISSMPREEVLRTVRYLCDSAVVVVR